MWRSIWRRRRLLAAANILAVSYIAAMHSDRTVFVDVAECAPDGVAGPTWIQNGLTVAARSYCISHVHDAKLARSAVFRTVAVAENADGHAIPGLLGVAVGISIGIGDAEQLVCEEGALAGDAPFRRHTAQLYATSKTE